MATGEQPLQLNFRRAGDDHDPIAQGFAIGFIKKGNICEKKLAGFAALFRFSGPLMADARMEDLLERALLFSVGEDYGPKCGPIQLPGSRKNFVAEALSQKGSHFEIGINKFSRRAIGIEELRASLLAKVSGKNGFAGRNPTGDPNDHAPCCCW